MSKTTKLRAYSRSVFVCKISLLCQVFQVTVNWWTNRCIPRHGEIAFCNNGFLAAPFEFLKKSQLLFAKTDVCVFKPNGVNAGDERVTWPLAGLTDSLFQPRSWLFKRLIKKAKIYAMALKFSVICRHGRTPLQLARRTKRFEAFEATKTIRDCKVKRTLMRAWLIW